MPLLEDICSVDSLPAIFFQVFTIRYAAYHLNIVPFLEKIVLVASEDIRVNNLDGLNTYSL